MLLAAVNTFREWGGRNKKLLSGLVGIAVEGAVQCVPGVGWAGDALGEMAKHGVERLLDPNAEVPGVKKAGETLSADQLAQLNTWLETLTTSYGGLVTRLDALVGEIESRNDSEVKTLIQQTLMQHEDLARSFDSSAREVRRLTLSLAGIERKLDEHCHVLNGVSASLEEIKGMLADAPVMQDWAKVRQARPDALDAILKADEHFLAGRRDQGMQALVGLLQQRGVGHETLCHHMGLLYMAGGQPDRAEGLLREAAKSSAGVSPGLALALTNTSTASGRTRGPSSWSTLPAGLVIDRRYRLEAEVGRGGMGSVYRAVGVDRLNRGQIVAIKVPAPDLMKTEQTIDRFMQEIRVSEKLSAGQHPHIVRTLNYVVFEDPRDSSELYGLVMEFVTGRSLADYLAERRLRNNPLSIAEVLRFMEPVCAALMYAHQQTPPILHRDVKPHNVMVTAKGEVKLMDFGIARMLDESAGSHLTAAPVGTPVYMPPEFLNPSMGVDARSDVYLAGNLLLELLTLHPMGDMETRPDCPPAWIDLVSDCMSRVRNKRPASVRDLVARLRGVNAQPPPAAIPVPVAAPAPVVKPAPPELPRPAPPPQPRLEVKPTVVERGDLVPGHDATFTLRLHNRGGGDISGTIESDVPWLVVVDASAFCFQTMDAVEVRIFGKTLRASTKPYEGRLLIRTNAGEAVVEVRALVPVTPFADGVLTSITSPRQMAEIAMKQPREVAALIESGAIAKWYEINGWTYPVQGPTAAGVGAVQQFFEALGVVKPPVLKLVEDEVRLVGRPGVALSHTLTITASERRPIYGQATSDKAWLIVERMQQAGQEAKIVLSVPEVPGDPGDVWLGEVAIVANGGQRLMANVELHVCEANPPPVPIACINPRCGVYTPGGTRHCARCHTPILGMPGMVVKDRYRLVELASLTEGIAVYRAEDIADRERVILLEDLVDTRPQHFDRQLDHFRKSVARLRELQPVAQVPRLYDFIEEPRAALVVREEIKGKSLLEAVGEQPGGKFPLARVRAWAVQLDGMLAFMHSLQPPYLCAILRPEDLVLEPDGQTLRYPQPGKQIIPARDPGAARYTAPEVWGGKAEPRSALFSLAATLYQLATGDLPDAVATGARVKALMERGTMAAEDRAFYAAVAKNLAADAEQRHESATAMRVALEGRP